MTLYKAFGTMHRQCCPAGATVEMAFTLHLKRPKIFLIKLLKRIAKFVVLRDLIPPIVNTDDVFFYICGSELHAL